ncbi:MAG: acetyl esterase [Gaiellaceae bacterium]|jgi:acetyl esterase|nr:acetyl esterase [Gaiellaceae bacterium]MDX6468391.1 acetyl esterase [Gaiellaceae bacterium]MDX6473199.1 acetyl esterase [Gaiellaceae bacterium]
MVGADRREETLAFNEQLRVQLATLPGVETVPPSVSRRARYEGRSIFPPPVFLHEARWVDVPSRGGVLRVRVLAPERDARGVYLHIHGGGWTIGAPDLHDADLSRLARQTGLVVASVEYRLAPEHPYPAAPDDCEDVALWLLERGAAELGAPALISIGGESAGAHLAAVTMLRLRDRHGAPDAFNAANLVYGAFDLMGTPSRWLLADALVLTDAGMTWFTDNFLPEHHGAERRDPDISPLYADLRGLPRALFVVGTADPLLDDTLFMAARWEAAGNSTTLRVYAEGVHGFNAFPIGIAEAANDAQIEFLKDAC